MSTRFEQIYEQLDFESGKFFKVSSWRESRKSLPPDEVLCVEKWIDACLRINEKYRLKEIKIDAIFFIQQNPVAIFAEINQLDKEIRTLAVRTIWNLARPRYLFLNDPVDTEVYDMEGDLNIISPSSLGRGLSFLLGLNREIIQNGYDLSDNKMQRKSADISLIQDLKELRRILTGKSKTTHIQSPLTYPQAHVLIAQIIFIRYLEDRAILDEAYFRDRVVRANTKWQQILNAPPDRIDLLNPDIADRYFPRILADRDLSVALFRQLASDFNGDVFSTNGDYLFVQQEHLTLIQQFLWASMEAQQKLFLWAYQFDVIPLELISSIYEEFYHGSNKAGDIKDDNGTHYTPPVLVEFMLSQVLTAKRLETAPRVLDAACGSGIFLVESFRRIVRYKMIFEGFIPDFKNLIEIVRQQIRGIEINIEAARVTAFSLYIALLDFLDPPHIRHYLDKEGGKLPYLLYSQKQTGLHLNVILDANAFWVENLFKQDTGLHDFQPGSVDVVVGNPPWGSAKKEVVEDNIAIDWCTQNGLPVSDNEWSQMFIWRSVSLLRPGGEAALLISSGTLLKSSDNAVEFKQRWTSKTMLMEVFNFVLARHVFFDNAISPFLGVVFKNSIPEPKHIIKYWTFRRTRLVDRYQIVVLDNTDLKLIPQSQAQVPSVWKIHQFGNHSDFALVRGLRVFNTLETIELKTGRRQGYIEGGPKSKKSNFKWLLQYKELPTVKLTIYGRYATIPNDEELTSIPQLIKEPGLQENYEGSRIIFKRGVSAKGENAGRIIARYESEKFAFRHSVNCFKLQSDSEENYKLILGVLWSMLAQYYYLMTASEWGVWHDSIEPTEMMRLPIPETEPTNRLYAQQIVQAVDSLRKNPPNIAFLERQLDEAVFNYYYLGKEEKQLIRDRCSFEIDAYYKNYKSVAFLPVIGLPGTLEGSQLELVNRIDEQQNGILAYLDSFYHTITPLLIKSVTLHHVVVRSKGLNPTDNQWTDAIAIIFFVRHKEDKEWNTESNLKEWADVVRLIAQSNTPVEVIRQSIYQDRYLRMVSASGRYFFILKRNERRLWTRTAAHEDAQALFAQSLYIPRNEHVTNGK